MNPERAARAYEKISEGYAELAFAVLETPGTQAGQPTRPGQSAGGGTPSVPPQSVTPPLAPSFDDLPPDALRAMGLTHDEWQEPQPLSQSDSRPVYTDQALGFCPDHKVPWAVKAGGVSKTGKTYQAFYKCPAKNEDEFCNRKPIKAWVDSHPIREGAA